jgi:hypothetical protein
MRFEEILENIDQYKASYVLSKAKIPVERAQMIFNTKRIDKIKASVVLNVVLLYMLENQ